MTNPNALTRDDILRRIANHPLGETPGDMRLNFERLTLGDGLGAARRGVTVTETRTGLTVRAETAGGLSPMPRVIWFHGGGYVFGSPETHLRPAMDLARSHRLTVHLPRYRLAPEAKWPAQLDDAMQATADGPPPILAGDSAGGHLALVTALEMARAGRSPLALMLFSPNTDHTGLSQTRARMDPLDPMVNDAGDRRLATLCFGDMPDDHRHVSPLLDDLSLLPPTWVEVGASEVLLGDSELLQRRASAQGAEIHLHKAPGLLHMGQLWTPFWDEARASLNRAADFALSIAARSEVFA